MFRQAANSKIVCPRMFFLEELQIYNDTQVAINIHDSRITYANYNTFNYTSFVNIFVYMLFKKIFFKKYNGLSKHLWSIYTWGARKESLGG